MHLFAEIIVVIWLSGDPSVARHTWCIVLGHLIDSCLLSLFVFYVSWGHISETKRDSCNLQFCSTRAAFSWYTHVHAGAHGHSFNSLFDRWTWVSWLLINKRCKSCRSRTEKS